MLNRDNLAQKLNRTVVFQGKTEILYLELFYLHVVDKFSTINSLFQHCVDIKSTFNTLKLPLTHYAQLNPASPLKRSMEVKVCFFARSSDLTGTRSTNVTIKDGSTTKELLDHLYQQVGTVFNPRQHLQKPKRQLSLSLFTLPPPAEPTPLPFLPTHLLPNF
jgi:hypothetical protein